MADAKELVSLRAVIVTTLITGFVCAIVGVSMVASYFYIKGSASVLSEKGEKIEHVSLETQYDTAIHEAGHVVEDYLRLPHRGVDETWVYVDRPEDQDVLGLTVFFSACGEFSAEECLRRDAMSDLAGLAAEDVLLKKKPPEIYQDKDRAGGRILDFCEAQPAECGTCPAESLVGSTCMLKGMMLSNRSKLYEKVKADVDANKETIVGLANLLFRKPVENGKRRLSRAEIEAFLAEHPLVDPTAPKEK